MCLDTEPDLMKYVRMKTHGVHFLDLVIGDPTHQDIESNLVQHLDIKAPGALLLDLVIGDLTHLDNEFYLLYKLSSPSVSVYMHECASVNEKGIPYF